MNHRFFPIMVLVVLLRMPVFSQEDSTSYTTFSKGRSLVALNGSISSSVNDRYSAFAQGDRAINNYAWQIRLAKLVARNYALGFSFEIQKQRSEKLLVLDNELFTFGPWMAYYLTKGQAGGLYLQTSLLFVSFQENVKFSYSNPPINESSDGIGFGTTIGFGYNYVVFDRIGLELSLNYNQAWIWGEFHDHIQRSDSKDTFTRLEVIFKFGFIVLFDKIKKDE